jgi:hypothetical protein
MKYTHKAEGPLQCAVELLETPGASMAGDPQAGFDVGLMMNMDFDTTTDGVRRIIGKRTRNISANICKYNPLLCLCCSRIFFSAFETDISVNITLTPLL